MKKMLLTTKEATKFYKISMPTLRKQIKTKEIKAIRVGKQWRVVINEEDLCK